MQIKLWDEQIYEEKVPFQMEWDCTGWHSDDPIFKKLMDEVEAALVVEVGSWRGAAAINFARVRSGVKVICVDTWLASIEHIMSDLPHDKVTYCGGYPTLYYQWRYNVIRAGFQKQITPLPLPSNQAAEYLRRVGVRPDMVYLDGAHDTESVISDLRGYFPLLRPGGILVGDDWGWPSIQQAARLFEKEASVSIRVSDNGNFWVLKAPPQH